MQKQDKKKNTENEKQDIVAELKWTLTDFDW